MIENLKAKLEFRNVMGIIKAAVIVFLVCFLYEVAESVIFFWSEKYSTVFATVGLALISSTLYFIQGFPIYLVSIKLFKSAWLLGVLSVLAIFYNIYSGAASAKNINLSSRAGGYDLFISGEITAAGVSDYIASPFLILFAYAVYLIVRKNLAYRGDLQRPS